MINETYLSLVNAYYDTIKPPSKKIKANMKKYRKLLNDKEDYTDDQYKTEYAKVMKELFEVIGKENLTKIFKAKIKKIYEIKKRPLNVDLDKYDGLSIEKIYNSIYSTLTEEEKKRVLSKTNKKVYKIFNKEEYKEAKKDRLYKEIKDQIMQSLDPEHKKEVLNPSKQKPVIIKSQNQNQTFKLPAAFYQQKTDNPEQRLRSLYNKAIKEDIKRDDIDNKIDLNYDGEGIKADISILGGGFKKHYDNFNKVYKDLTKLKEEQQKDYDLSDLDRKYYVEKYKDFINAKNDLLYAYEDCGIIEARELIKLHREILKELNDDYGVKLKKTNRQNQKQKQKDKEGDEPMQDVEEEEDDDDDDDNGDDDDPGNTGKEVSKKVLNGYLKYIEKIKLMRYLELYDKVCENGKLLNLVRSCKDCFLFTHSTVESAIRKNANIPDDTEPKQQQQQPEDQPPPAPPQPEPENNNEEEEVKQPPPPIAEKMIVEENNEKQPEQEQEAKPPEPKAEIKPPDQPEPEPEPEPEKPAPRSEKKTPELNIIKIDFNVPENYEELNKDGKIKLIGDYKSKIKEFISGNCNNERVKGKRTHPIKFNSEEFKNSVDEVNKKLNIDFEFNFNLKNKASQPSQESYNTKLNKLIVKCDEEIKRLSALPTEPQQVKEEDDDDEAKPLFSEEKEETKEVKQDFDTAPPKPEQEQAAKEFEQTGKQPQQKPSFNFSLNNYELEEGDNQIVEQQIRNDIYDKLIKQHEDGLFLYKIMVAYQKDRTNFAKKWFSGVIKNPENNEPLNPDEYIALANKYKDVFVNLGKKMNYIINPKRSLQTPEEKEAEMKNYNIEYYDEFNKICNIFKKFRDDITSSETYKKEFGTTTSGQGLKGFKHLKINPIMKGGPPKIKGFAEALKEKQNENKSLNKNNSCLVGGRILTLNELDQIIDRIKKQ